MFDIRLLIFQAYDQTIHGKTKRSNANTSLLAKSNSIPNSPLSIHSPITPRPVLPNSQKSIFFKEGASPPSTPIKPSSLQGESKIDDKLTPAFDERRKNLSISKNLWLNVHQPTKDVYGSSSGY